MKRKLNQSKQINAVLISVLAGTAAAIIFTAAATMIVTSMMNNGVIGESGILPATWIIWLTSSLVGALISCIILKNNIFPFVFATSVLYFMFMMAIKIIFFDTPFTGIGRGVLAILIGSIPALLMIGRQKNGKKTKVKYNIK